MRVFFDGMSRPLFFVLLSLMLAAPAARADETTLSAGREHTRAFQEGAFDALWQRMTPQMQEALGSEEALAQLREAIDAGFGAEETVLSETTETQSGYRVYLRTAEHEKGAAALITQWSLDAENRIAGFFVRPAQEPAESRFLDYRTQAELRLPFDGAWHVFWGGRTVEANYHAVDAGQRFASDFVMLENGSSHAADGSSLEDYHCWGRPILAPADGTVVAFVDGLPDQPIGEMDPQNPAGNHVVIDLGNDEYIFLAHLRQGSVAVDEGDAVTRGQEIGRCGNSGNSSEPHLHFHLQTTPVLGEGEGLAALFNSYLADGEPVETGEPERGQTVEPQGDE